MKTPGYINRVPKQLDIKFEEASEFQMSSFSAKYENSNMYREGVHT